MKIKTRLLSFIFVLTFIFTSFSNVRAIEKDDLTTKSKETVVEFCKALANWNLDKIKETVDEDIYNWLISNKDKINLSKEQKDYISNLSSNDKLEVKTQNEKTIVTLDLKGLPIEFWVDNKNIRIINFITNPIKFINVSDNEKLELQKYLEQNNVNMDLNLNNDENLLKIFNEDLTKNEIFLTGESHATAKNIDLKLNFLKFFNKYAGVKYYLSESGYSEAQLINKFLETGDRKLLDYIFKNLEGTFAYNRDDYNQYIKLYEYNKKLDKNNKIKIVGIDIEHQQLTAYTYLVTILPKTEAPKSIRANILLLKNKNLKGLGEKLQKDIQAHKEEYKKYLGNNFFDFNFVVDNIQNSSKCYSSDNSKFSPMREACINENFKKIYNHLPKGKYYGQFGMAHVYQMKNGLPYVDENVFGKFISKEFAPTKGKVISISYLYKNSYQRMQDGQLGKIHEEYDFETVSNMINDITKSETTIFKLNTKDSPFNKSPYLIPSPMGGCTTESFQYLVIVKNSQAASDYNKIKN